jgi:streptogramin lyase
MQERPLRASLFAALLALVPVRAWAQPITEFALPAGAPVNTGSDVYAHSMTAGPDGALWMTEAFPSRIVRMLPDGSTTEFDVAPGIAPSGITVGPDQNIWFGLAGGPSGIGRISMSGQLVEFPLNLHNAVTSGFVSGLDGNVWFTEAEIGPPADPGWTAIGKVTPGGQITTYSLPLGTSATGIIVSPEGSLWALVAQPTEPFAGIQRINLDGSRRSVVASLDPDRAIAMTLGPDGNAWITAKSNTVAKVAPAGVVTKYAIPTPGALPFDITAGPDGNLWFTEYDGNKIGRITPQGVITEFAVPTPDSGPAAICVGPDGNIWFSESKANKVGRLALSGPAAGNITLTVPAAASSAGLNGTFFHTDLWLMNRSFTSPVVATLTYRCATGLACGNAVQAVTLPARQSAMLTDVIGRTFSAPSTSGAIEVSWPTTSGPVSVSSQVSSPLPPAPAFGTLVPALPLAAAKMHAVFIGVESGGSLASGSRSSVGAYNPQPVPVDVTFALYKGDGTTLGTYSRTYGPNEAYQLYPNVFDLLGVGSTAATDAYLVVSATAPVFPYVTVIDNVSGDSSFLCASDDETAP